MNYLKLKYSNGRVDSININNDYDMQSLNERRSMMKYITVLDFEDGRVYQYDIEKLELKENETYFWKRHYKKEQKWCPDTESCESFLNSVGHKIDNIQWMVHKDGRIITP